MKFIDNLLLKYTKFLENMNANAKVAEIRAEENQKKYYLGNYGAYHNASELTQKEMLEVFWKMLKNDGYDVSNFGDYTNIREPGKQRWDWDDLGEAEFITDIEKMFEFLNGDIADGKRLQIKTFGELADFIIKKAKEKKQKQHVQ